MSISESNFPVKIYIKGKYFYSMSSIAVIFMHFSETQKYIIMTHLSYQELH